YEAGQLIFSSRSTADCFARLNPTLFREFDLPPVHMAEHISFSGAVQKKAGEPWKCPHCRKKFHYGSTVVQRLDMKWYGCVPCATLTSCGRPAILLPVPSTPETGLELDLDY